MPERKKKQNYTYIVASAKASLAMPFLQETLIKRWAFESFSRYSVFDGWISDKPFNARVIILTAI